MSRKIGHRCHVVITPLQDERLKKLVKSTGLLRAEHIRRAIDVYFRALEAAEQRKKP